MVRGCCNKDNRIEFVAVVTVAKLGDRMDPVRRALFFLIVATAKEEAPRRVAVIVVGVPTRDVNDKGVGRSNDDKDASFPLLLRRNCMVVDRVIT